jgi:glycosyltransferase involved in cell wall biosynthesis
MNRPRLSILIPTYNRAGMLVQTLDSLVTQTYLPEDVEVIVSDDGSTDETLEVVERYRERVPSLRVYAQTSNLGGSENWAFLLAKAEGELVFLLCHDDAIAPDFLETCLPLFGDDPKLDMVLGDIELRGPDFEPLSLMTLSTPEGYAEGTGRCLDQLRSHHMIMSTVYRRSTLLAASGWDGQVGSHLDCTAYCRAALRARKTYRIPRPMLYFRVSEGSWSHTLSTQNQAQLARWYRRKLDLLVKDARALHPEIEPEIQAAYRTHARTVLAYLEIELAHHRLTGTRLREAVRELLDVFPESRGDSMVWKVRLASYLGTGWLSALRHATGRPDPYNTTLSLFNSFSNQKPRPAETVGTGATNSSS